MHTEKSARTTIRHALANFATSALKHTWGYSFGREEVRARSVTADESSLLPGGQSWDVVLLEEPDELWISVIETPYEREGWVYRATLDGEWGFDLHELYDHSSSHDQALMSLLRSICWHCITVSGMAERSESKAAA